MSKYICILVCRYEGITGKVAVDEGKHIGEFQAKSLDECKKVCDEKNTCNSFALCFPQSNPTGNCFPKEKVIQESEITKDVTNVGTIYGPITCTTYDRKCGNHDIF